MVRWKLMGHPDELPLDMLLTVPVEAFDVSGAFYADVKDDIRAGIFESPHTFRQFSAEVSTEFMEFDSLDDAKVWVADSVEYWSSVA
jgi:hypothetical protein